MARIHTPEHVSRRDAGEPTRRRPAAVAPRWPHAGHEAVLMLQRQAGNRAVVAALAPLTRTVSRRTLARNVVPGDKLPDLDQALKEKVERQVPDDELLRVAKLAIGNADRTTRTAARRVAMAKDGLPPSEEVIAAATKVLTDGKAATSFADLERQALERAREEDRKRDAEASQPTGMETSSVTVEGCVYRVLIEIRSHVVTRSGEFVKGLVESNRERTAPSATIEPDAQRDFAEALLGFPVIKEIVGSAYQLPGATSAPPASHWKGGKRLRDRIVAEAQGGVKSAPTPKLLAALDLGERFLMSVLEPRLAEAIEAPVVYVHPDPPQGGFRPYHDYLGVHFPDTVGASIVVHEVGHYLEESLPVGYWADLRSLILQRHGAADGGTVALQGAKETPDEGRFAGRYPGTGDYTSTAYRGGDTEVTSMTLQWLMYDATTLVENDPVQVAIVLRGMRPDEYSSTPELRKFDPYLPQDKDWKPATAPAPESPAGELVLT